MSDLSRKENASSQVEMAKYPQGIRKQSWISSSQPNENELNEAAGIVAGVDKSQKNHPVAKLLTEVNMAFKELNESHKELHRCEDNLAAAKQKGEGIDVAKDHLEMAQFGVEMAQKELSEKRHELEQATAELKAKNKSSQGNSVSGKPVPKEGDINQEAPSPEAQIKELGVAIEQKQIVGVFGAVAATAFTGAAIAMADNPATLGVMIALAVVSAIGSGLALHQAGKLVEQKDTLEYNQAVRTDLEENSAPAPSFLGPR